VEWPNIATNIYLYEEFNDLCGFTEAEVVSLLRQVTDARNMSQAQYTLDPKKKFRTTSLKAEMVRNFSGEWYNRLVLK